MQRHVQQRGPSQDEPAMFEAPISNNNDDRSRGQSPPCANPCDVMDRSQFTACSARTNVPAGQGEKRQKQDRGPTEVAESRRRLVVIGASIEPGNNGPNAEQNCNQQQTNLRPFQTKEVRRKFLSQLILPEEIPFRFYSGICRGERICFLAQFPIHSRNARSVGKKNRQRGQRHQTGQPQQQIAQREAGKKLHAAWGNFFPYGWRHSLALNQK